MLAIAFQAPTTSHFTRQAENQTVAIVFFFFLQTFSNTDLVSTVKIVFLMRKKQNKLLTYRYICTYYIPYLGIFIVIAISLELYENNYNDKNFFTN